ncbi:glycosyltransferase family 2 protein [Hypoxylon crocopeplum]|nr:glycosyltransferase family 2 protein [Hypoxylon crocopeplum]
MAHRGQVTRADNSSTTTDEDARSYTESPFADPPGSFSPFTSPPSASQYDRPEVDGFPQGASTPGRAVTTNSAMVIPPKSPRRSMGAPQVPALIFSPPESSGSTSPPSPTSRGSATSSEIHRRESLASFPPLTVNETTSAMAADAIDPVLIKKGKRKVARHKYIAIFFIFSANFMMIFSSWYWPKYYYIYLPFISLPLILNCVMIFDIIVWSLKNLVFKPKKIIPEKPEEMVLLMPCYNETFEECTRSLDSLVNQINVGHHKQAILVVCDGKVRGPGMDKTTGDYLNQDIFTDQIEKRIIRAAYVAWDGQSMDVEISRGMYKGLPYFCIVKQQNQGKRDSLIVARSFVHNFNLRHNRPKVIFRPEFFKAMSNFLTKDAGITHVELLIGMDADTIFANDCIGHLVDESHYPGTVGVCGYVAVDFSQLKWNLWSIYQSAEYTIAQGLRRLHQSLCTKKVSCLPGCCQLLRVCEETCGDFILIQEFGYHPKPTDGIIARIRATASEDRNHVCLMLMKFPKAKTRQALRAYAYTDVPHSLSVFLSQRRRWTLGATGNDLMLLMESNWRFNLWERLVALSNVLTWILNFFVIASLGCMVYAFMHQPFWIIMIFASIMIIPLCYYLSLTVWLCRNWLERRQFLLGVTIFTICGPFINICVTLYACFYMDNFGWGKTRKVVAETGEAEEPDVQAQHDRFEEALNNNEKIIGTLVPDEENQLAPEVYLTPFTVPAGSTSILSRTDSESVFPIATPVEQLVESPLAAHLEPPVATRVEPHIEHPIATRAETYAEPSIATQMAQIGPPIIPRTKPHLEPPIPTYVEPYIEPPRPTHNPQPRDFAVVYADEAVNTD